MSAHKPLQSSRKLLPVVLGVGLLLLFSAAPAPALTYTYTFDAITSNNPANAAAGEAQLRMDVTGEPSSTTVTFTFYLAGDIPMSITGIYFYDGVLGISGTSFSQFVFSPEWDKKEKSGVLFSMDSKSPSLPGSNLPKASVVFAAVSEDQVKHTGVSPGESLSIVFQLAGGYDIYSVKDALDGWLTDHKFDSGDLVVGLHVQAIKAGTKESSESFVVWEKVPVSPVPLPGSALLLGSGLAALGMVAWRRRRGQTPPPL